MSAENIQEHALRERLGIPVEAHNVLIFGETSHWDPNWLYTSEEYYDLRIWRVMDAAIEALTREPRRVFALESLYFVQLYWQRRPEQQDILRQLVNEGRLRLTGSGITTPDTVLPHTEAIIRDYLHGQEWLREHGMTAEPRLAYLPDDFGYSPALPSLLQSLGYDMAGITRIDGMYFVACDYRPKSAFPLPGSSAHSLTHTHKTLDFVWRAPDGAEVLTHWNAFSYFQGDMLACVGIIRWMGKTFGAACRNERHIARRIASYVDQLRPLALTPYMFCPIGCDFNQPIDGLVELLDRFNRTRFGKTGVWAIAAGMDDYLQLVGFYRDRLPVLTLDPNPYWMGFYASRQEAKLRCNRIARKLLLAEKLSAFPRNGTPHGDKTRQARDASLPETANKTTDGAELQRELRHAWERLVLSNHHDFITGTSPDRIWDAEQQPCLQEAEALVDSALQRVAHHDKIELASGSPPRWTLSDGALTVSTQHYRAELSEAFGGCLISLKLTNSGEELLAGPANDLVAYKDSGGLWRMGHEYAGGVFQQRSKSSKLAARIEARERGDLLEVKVHSELAGKPFVRWLWFRPDSPIIRMRLIGAAAKRRTITCRFPTTLRADRLAMDVPGGVVVRPGNKLYDPTFWPARSFVHMHDRGNDRGLAAFLGGPAAAALDDEGVVEWMAFRNAPKEIAYGFLPILAHPARGTDPHEGHFDYAVWFTENGDYRANHLPLHVRRALRAAMFDLHAPDLDELANAIISADSDDVLVIAVKTASRGPGLIARLRHFGQHGQGVTRLRCQHGQIREAKLCDARERDLGEIEVQQGHVYVPLDAGILSVRLIVD